VRGGVGQVEGDERVDHPVEQDLQGKLSDVGVEGGLVGRSELLHIASGECLRDGLLLQRSRKSRKYEPTLVCCNA